MATGNHTSIDGPGSSNLNIHQRLAGLHYQGKDYAHLIPADGVVLSEVERMALCFKLPEALWSTFLGLMAKRDERIAAARSQAPHHAGAGKTAGGHSGQSVNPLNIEWRASTDSASNLGQQTTLERIEQVRRANAQSIHVIGDRISALVSRPDGAKLSAGETADEKFVSKGALNDMLEDINADGHRLAEILADLDQLEALL